MEPDAEPPACNGNKIPPSWRLASWRLAPPPPPTSPAPLHNPWSERRVTPLPPPDSEEEEDEGEEEGDETGEGENLALQWLRPQTPRTDSSTPPVYDRRW